MTAALAILLAQAAAACPAAPPTGLPGGATIIRPVGTGGAIPFEKLGPAIGLPKSSALKQAGAHTRTENPPAQPPAADCDGAPVHFV